MAPTRVSSCSSSSPCDPLAADAAAPSASTPLVAGRDPSQSSESGADRVSEPQAREPKSAALQSLLTPLVAEQLVLSTPAPPAANEGELNECDRHAEDEEHGSSAQVAVETENEEEEEKEEKEPANPQVAPKRSPRALFGSFDGEDEVALTCEQVCDEAARQRGDDDRLDEQLQLEGTRERKRASPFAEFQAHVALRKSVHPAAANAFDGDLDDEPTLVIRKKWKRSLPPTPLSSGPAAQRRGIFSPPESQPSRPSFVRSMSSQSIFIGKATTAATSSDSASSSATQLLTPSKLAVESLIHQLALPTTHSKSHPDLNVITPETVSRLLRGDFAEQLASYALVDCRFAYEFQGGSLRTAQSLCDPASVEQQFLWNPPSDCKRTALIFFCEFSANRAPKMLRHVRNLDRWIHAEQYPELFYPELYLIDGGYKNCFETVKEICDPPSYTPMNHSAFVPSCKSAFGLWRKHWKAHKTSTCAAKLQHHHHLQKLQQNMIPKTLSTYNSQDDDDDDDSAAACPPPPAPPVTMRSLSEML